MKKPNLSKLAAALLSAGIYSCAPLTAVAAINDSTSNPETTTSTQQATNVGEVSAQAGALSTQGRKLARTDGKLTKKKIFHSTQSQAVLGKRAIAGVGPAAGAAQALSLAPGVAVRGYGGVASTARYEIAVRGVKVGWSSVNGDVERNGLTVLFDGIPMNNLIAHNGGWVSISVEI